MEQYQRLTAVVDLTAIKNNIKSIRKKIGSGIKMICVIKADAYGHGAVESAKAMAEAGADMFAVAFIDEAIELRKNGIDKPILILGYTSSSRMEDVVNFDVCQTIYSRQIAEELNEAAKRNGKIAKGHIKLDTGMGRIGFRGEIDDIEDIKYISKLENICLEGIFTHFATADEADKSFTYEQAKRFKETLDKLEKDGISFDIIHCSNSAGIMEFDELMFTAVRPGIIQYGLYPSDEVCRDKLEITPAMSLKSHISFIKTVEEGTPIGYGRAYFAPSKRVIATVPVGYADGYLRSMKNGRVIINGKYAPITGRVCMDQFMVDVTDIDAKVGDEVVIMGKQGELEVSADEIASVMGTINYEVICLISRRVPRIYFENGIKVKTVSYI